jgi:hypothetical protein
MLAGVGKVDKLAWTGRRFGSSRPPSQEQCEYDRSADVINDPRCVAEARCLVVSWLTLRGTPIPRPNKMPLLKTPPCSWTFAGAIALATFMVSTDAQAQSGRVPRVARRVSATDVDSKHPLGPAIRYARKCYTPLAKVKDYDVSFAKRELVDGEMVEQKLRIKLREKPFSVYLYFKGNHEGREVIYVTGKNDGDLLVHETGIKSIIGTLGLPPTGDRAMSENRYPVTKIGIGNMLDAIVQQWEKEARKTKPTVKYYPNAKVGDTQCRVIESTHAKKGNGVTFHRTRLFIDRETGLPIRVQQFGFPKKSGAKPSVIEDYTYSKIKTNVGLQNRDFDTDNPKYGF